jgi:PHD/YefM family antitoxin component YafN of YafNO toxin-antitoxin module
MPAKRTQAKEIKAPYRTKRKAAVKPPERVMLRWSEIENAAQPIVLERDGQPVAVVMRYADYQQMDASRAERREAAWRELDTALAQVHARTQSFSDQEIQADITAARQEVREQRHALHHRG